ncbi:hypothetical protein SNOG_04662 [Parastagonospora nodorum SN15]|uniref:Uncharacterized protein n=1 Tax=Phaeosphaeria nodorum (strain SN15 / ATCC MYA-4574 / FGSC 10173) TaxID=321614 RepID=Q0UUA2_PHANO|nr:hypothetical protein SNOG_04662 [Parastagonospora nodorum SN15]EAT88422.1 hypothetical protein SNOG_04662 [Parastagonospora nodorum SN15]
MPNPTDSMTNRNPPQLELRVAELHMRSQRELHVDSEEAVQHERRRVSRELEPIHAHESSRRSSEVLHQSPDHASLRSRNASSRNSTGSHNSPRPGVGNEGTATDTSQTTIQSTTPSSRWYTPITSFWSTHISLKIDSNAHRDHLGTFPSPPSPMSLTQHSSPRTHFPRLPAYLPDPRRHRSPDRPTFPTPARRQSESRPGVLRDRPPAECFVHRYGVVGGCNWGAEVLEVAEGVGEGDGAGGWVGGIGGYGGKFFAGGSYVCIGAGSEH